MIACGLLAAPQLPAAAPDVDIRRDATVEAAAKVMPCVVNIATEEVVDRRDAMEEIYRDFFGPYYRRRQPNTSFSLGSGVVIDEEGYVLTNFHVVNRARRVWVKFADGREYECERLVGTSISDVALLKIRGKAGEKFPAVKFAADDDLLLGETVLALGNPFGLGTTISRGILSAKSRRPARENEPLDMADWLQTDASINPGNSGGPLINLRGELIGICVAIYREGQGIGFAVPVKRVTEALAEIYSPEYLAKLWFGARVRPGNAPLQVISVQPDSPAAKAGLRTNDLIVEINGKKPRSFIDFSTELSADKKDKSVALLVQRGRETKTVKVQMTPEKDVFNAELIRKKTGLALQELTEDLAASLKIGKVDGLLVSGVDKESPASKANIDHGMIVTSIDGRNYTDVISAAKALSAKNKGDKVSVEILYARQRGFFIQYQQATVELTVK
jgi:S1-C subfamily serine protease